MFFNNNIISGTMSKYISDNDSVLRATFSFEDFLKHTGLNTVLIGFNSSTTANAMSQFDYRAVQLAIRTIGDKFEGDPNIDTFLPTVPDLLFDICFDGYFLPYMSSEFRQSFNNLNVSHTTDIKKRLAVLVEAANETVIFKNSTPTDLKPDVGPITALPSGTFFTFGQSLYNLTAEFNADSFKSKISPIILKAFLPVFFYRYLHNKLTSCGANQEACKRNFALGRLVFVYFMAMSLFLIVFSDPERIKKYKSVTNDNDAVLKERKERLLRIMDAVLIKLGDKALMVPSEGGEQRPADVAQFYDSVKKLSLNNVKESNDLSHLKDDIQTMQNNLSNYNQMESLNARNVFYMKLMFYGAAVFAVIVVSFTIGLTFTRRFAFAEAVSLVALIACLVSMWLNYTRTIGDGGKSNDVIREWVTK